MISNYVLIFGSTTFPMIVASIRRCELISNYVLIFGSTTNQQDTQVSRALWIDFKLCSYFWFDNLILVWNSYCLVVNWFQIMFLFLVRQLPLDCRLRHTCCELISNYVLIFGSTTLKRSVYVNGSLWIDFKLCSYFWFDNVVEMQRTKALLWIDFKLCSYFWFDNWLLL